MSIVWNPVSWMNKKFIILLSGVIIILMMIDWSVFNLNSLHSEFFSKEVKPKLKTIPLLLEYANSAQEAQVKVIIWFDKQDPVELFREELPLDNWYWEKSFHCTSEGKKITGLVGQTRVDRIKELELKKWYFKLAGRIKDAGGKVYLDERIYTNIDIVAFLCKAGAEPQQWMLDGNTLSVAALKSELGNNIYAGKDKVNMQLLTRISNGYQQSVLALPVLIDEF